MISRENYDESVQKWTTIKRILSRHDEISIRPIIFDSRDLHVHDALSGERMLSAQVVGACGFCKESTSDCGFGDVHGCKGCPLAVDEYCWSSGMSDRGLATVFWKFVTDLENRRFSEALVKAEKILDRIKAEPIAPEAQPEALPESQS